MGGVIPRPILVALAYAAASARLRPANDTTRPRPADVIGRDFGRLTVLEIVSTPAGSTGRHFRCRCACGNVLVVRGRSLYGAGHATRSCGCLRRDRVMAANTTHGGTLGGRPSPEYRVWQGMIRRCENPRGKFFRHYGGRGIRVCDRWRRDFAAFLADIGPRPSSKHSIDRIDNDGHYEPGNCRWVTQRDQVLNTRRARWFEYRGRAYRLHELVALSGHSKAQLRARLQRGWTVDAAVETPDRKRPPDRFRAA